MEYNFFEEEEHLKMETDVEYDTAPMNLPGIKLVENEDDDQNEQFDVDDMNKVARQSENNAEVEPEMVNEGAEDMQIAREQDEIDNELHSDTAEADENDDAENNTTLEEDVDVFDTEQ